MPFPFLNALCIGVVATLILAAPGTVYSREDAPSSLPTKTHPLWVDAKNRQVLIYSEVNLKNWENSNPHWGVVFRGGKLGDKAILSAFCTPQEFHEALLQIGAQPGNNLTKDKQGAMVQGDELIVSAMRPGQTPLLSLADLISDQTGKGFQIRFGGNKERAATEKTGCITCLESCPVGITSNAAYPTISSFKRFVSPNSMFKGRSEDLLPRESTPVILIYQLTKAH